MTFFYVCPQNCPSLEAIVCFLHAKGTLIRLTVHSERDGRAFCVKKARYNLACFAKKNWRPTRVSALAGLRFS